MKKKYTQMTAKELAEATQEFDRPEYEPKFLKAPRKQQQRHDAILQRARRGRPTVGAGSQRIQVTMERHLLARIDEYARQNHLTRSQLLARGVEAVLAGAA